MKLGPCDCGSYRTSREVWIRAKGPIPPGLCVLHKCDVPYCRRMSHLFLGTYKTNTQDMIRKGRRKSREGPLSNEHKAKLSAALKGKPKPTVSAALKGYVHTSETRARMSAAKKGNFIPWNKGKSHPAGRTGKGTYQPNLRMFAFGYP